MHLVSVVLVLFLLGVASSTSYEGFKVYKVFPKTEADNQYLLRLEKNKNFDFWGKVNKLTRPVTVMASQAVQRVFEKSLIHRKIYFKILIENVENFIQEERAHQRSRKFEKRQITFDQYYRHSEVNAYLAQLEADNPDLVTVENIGLSYENRSMDLIRISSGPSSSNEPKPVIFIDGGIHAREWISPAVCLYMINQLVENQDNRNLLEEIDWVVLPVLNPDGYEFTFDQDRLWRKTLSPGVICDGTDANRNFGFHWMEAGASDFECASDYAGSEAFSEVEARNVRDYIARTENIKAYISFHSFAQAILYPYAYGYEFPDNKEELEDLANKINDAISSVAGTTYDIGSPPMILYEAAGASMDWAAAPEGGNVSIVYTIELPGGGFFGFDLPASEIEGVGVETWEGVKVLHDHIVQKAHSN